MKTMLRNPAGIALALLVASQAAVADDIAWTGLDGTDAQDWFRPANWDLGRVPQDGDDVTIKPASGSHFYVTLTNSTPHLKSLWMGSGSGWVSKSPDYRSVLTVKNWTTCLHADDIHLTKGGIVQSGGSFDNGAMSNRIWIAGVNMTLDYYDGTIERDGGLAADGCGYNGANGPCWAGGTANNTYSGAYGGRQGRDAGVGSHTYGSAEWPFDPGSGGGNSGWAYAGGGAIFVDLTGDLVVNGGIRANGPEGGGTPYRSSGGGIVIKCATLTGSGVISACAGASTKFSSNGGRNGAGGGRIAVHYDTAKQAAAMPNCHVRIAALGGGGGGIVPGTRAESTSGTTADAGEPGTLWFPDDAMLKMSPLRLGGRLVTVTSGTTLTFDGLTMSEALLGFDVPVTVQVNGDLVSSATLSFASGLYFAAASTLKVTGDATFTGSKLWVTSGGTYTFAGDLTLASSDTSRWYCGGELDAKPPAGAGAGAAGVEIAVGGKLTVNKGCAIFARAQPASGEVAKFKAKTFELCAGAAIDANTLGYTAGNGPGYSAGYGASHGGQGSPGGSSAKPANDDLRWPTLPGSGSNCRTGGGVVWVEATKALTLNGTVGANGSGTSGGSSGYHASAGGSVLLVTRRFYGTTGTIAVHGGGAGGSSGAYGGGGGRIAIRCNHDCSSLGDFDVAGGSSMLGSGPRELPAGGDGTVYRGPWFRGTTLVVR